MTARFDLVTRILVWLGLRSSCCGAELYEPTGWGRLHCSACRGRDRRSETPASGRLALALLALAAVVASIAGLVWHGLMITQAIAGVVIWVLS